jgi:hypothetical protein
VLEEFLIIRGAVFGNLLRGHSLRTANAVSALLLVAGPRPICPYRKNRCGRI